MYAFYFFKTERELVFNIKCSIGIMRQLSVLMITIFFRTCTQSKMPFQSHSFPMLKPLFLSAWANKELHFHLLKFTHTDYELPCNHLITECFSYLCDTKR